MTDSATSTVMSSQTCGPGASMASTTARAAETAGRGFD
jgi:hypothetical protein